MRCKSTEKIIREIGMPNRKMFKEKNNNLSPNSALVGRNSNLKTESKRKGGRELFPDKYLVMAHNDA